MRIKFLFLIVVCFVSVSANAGTVVAELVWVDYVDEQHYIYFSRFDGDDWTDPGKSIYSSDRALTGPALGTDSSGHKILIWTEQFKLKTALMSMTTNSHTDFIGSLDWSEPVMFSNYGVENFAPNIVFDSNDDGWVFWSASKVGDDSDIFLARYVNRLWRSPLIVNKPNKVVDFAPMASLNQSGDVTVAWNRYDPKLGGYTLDSRVYIVENSAQIDINGEKSLNNTRLPIFLPRNQRILLHFPNNKMQQSTPIN